METLHLFGHSRTDADDSVAEAEKNVFEAWAVVVNAGDQSKSQDRLESPNHQRGWHGVSVNNLRPQTFQKRMQLFQIERLFGPAPTKRMN
jgi:hypothetical protein